MYNFSLIFIVIIFLSCDSKIQNSNLKEESWKPIILSNLKPPIVEKKIKLGSVIYDTLVFNKNTNARTLNERFENREDELNFYKKFINKEKLNQIQIINEKYSKTKIKYLGRLNDLNKLDSYHVITIFKIIGIGQMLSPRGRSEVAFINESLNKIIIYNLPMPDDLPKKIVDNILFFQFEKTKIGISILGGLPSELCIPIIGCN